MEKSIARVEKDLAALKPGERVSYKVYTKVAGKQGVVGIRRHTEYGYGSEFYEVVYAPKTARIVYGSGGSRYLQEAVNAVRETLQNAITKLRNVRDKDTEQGGLWEASSQEIVDLYLLRRECLKYTQAGKTYKSRASKVFPVDVTGWKYVKTDEPVIEFAGTLLREKLGPEDINKALHELGWKEITVEVHFVPAKTSLGKWFGNRKLLQVRIRGAHVLNVRGFNNYLRGILRTVRHEVQHVGQDLLPTIKMVVGVQDMGLPSIRLREFQGRRRKRKQPREHALRDVEFYTRLADEISEYVAEAQKTQPRYYEDLFHERLATRTFFQKLQEYQPKKYRKAVSEFYKGISERGYGF